MESEHGETPPVSKKRRRKHCHRSGDQKRSSSSHTSSVEFTTTATCRPTIIATATSVSSSSKAPSHEEAAIAMATVLASELRPEHKLPNRDILVQPKPKFMELLQTVGAQGTVFTARQVLCYLIKYISSRQLYIQHDPKRVYCEKDPLGEVFGVTTFTIKDARKLLFENMSVLRESPDFQSQHNESFQRQQRKLYYTFHQAQQTTDVTRPTPVPTRSATAPSPSSLPSASHRLNQVDSINEPPSSVKRTVGGGKFTESSVFRGEDLPDSAHISRPRQFNRDYAVSVNSAKKGLPVSELNMTSSATMPLSDKVTCTITPTSAHRQHSQAPPISPKLLAGKETVSKRSPSSFSPASFSPASASGISMLRSPFSCGRKRKQSRLTSDSSEDCVRVTSHQNTETDRANRPWYCMLYHPSEELKSQGSEVLSIQDCETAIAADSSDDLWFVDEDEGTPVNDEGTAVEDEATQVEDAEIQEEYEVPSDSSDDYTINKGSSDGSSSGTELVYDVLLQRADSGDSHFADNSDEDTTDTEISDLDKWECMECSMRNSPFERYCSRCWALRKGWLPDNQRMTLKERLQNSNRSLRRSFSAPAGNINPPSPWCPAHTPVNVETGDLQGEIATELNQNQPGFSRDFTDGLTFDQEKEIPGGNVGNDEDEAGTGFNSSREKNKRTISDEHGENSQDTVLIARDSHGYSTESDTQTEVEKPQSTQGIHRREDSGIGLTQESQTSSKLDRVKSSVTPSKSQVHHAPNYSPRKRQRSASGSDLPERSGLSLSVLKSLKRSTGKSTIRQVGMGVLPHSIPSGKSDPGAGPSSAQANAVTKHYNDLCIICYSRPKTASIIHGRTGHQVCCYPCAKKLHHRGKPCPVCRRSIQAVIKNFLL